MLWVLSLNIHNIMILWNQAALIRAMVPVVL